MDLAVCLAVETRRAVDNELGVVRAYDVRSGTLLWDFDPIPQDPADPAYVQWRGKLAHGPMPIRDTVDIMRQVAEALAFARLNLVAAADYTVNTR